MLGRAALLVGSLLLSALLLEAALRVSPRLWPYGDYAFPRFDADLQLTVHGGPTIYNRGRLNRRAPNRDGFLDVDHARAKPAGVRRVGFFGDSYVEALQVPLERTFFRRLPPEIDGRPLEAFAFGISGWATLHALVTYRVMGPRYDLDDVVYVFVRNDPGDNDVRTRHRMDIGAELSADPMGFVLWPPPPAPLVQRLGSIIGERSMLARVLAVQSAVRLRRWSTRGPGDMPDPNDDPSTWPPQLLAEVQALSERILRELRDEVARDGRRFAVLYVPNGERELEGTIAPADLWLPWLARTCASLGIPLWDPTRVLSDRHAAGIAIYGDHWTPAGHEAIAAFVADHLAAPPAVAAIDRSHDPRP